MLFRSNDGTHTILLNVNADSSKLNENLQGLIQVLRRESVNQSQLGQKLSKALKEVKGDMLVKNQLGYASEDMVLYGQQDVIQSLIIKRAQTSDFNQGSSPLN